MNVPATPPEPPRLSYLNLSLSEKGISELQGTRRMVFIPKEKVQSVEIKFGSRAERPWLQTLLALGLLALGGTGLYVIFASGMRGVRWGAGLLIFGGLGVFSLLEVVKKGHYVEVVSTNDTRKLILKGAVKKEELARFIQDASRLGYHFKGDINF